MANPGDKYALLYALVDPNFTLPKEPTRFEDAGKVMALAPVGRPDRPTATSRS
ncbi:hypothetical protein [Mesorhizobium amorphae]|uniref:hypothetical protein n=1 Tax=Mesorhizobium amorphae TaxID=71433 RepID=UPI0002F4A4FC|nr:hypothetical protein [Mesorhizobium amorphae]